MNELDKRIEELKQIIKIRDKAYYEDNQPLGTDAEYDELKKELEHLLKERSGNFLFDDDIELDVGFKPGTRFKQVRHSSPMLSLSNALDENEFDEFFIKIRRFLNLENQDKIDFCVELKIDGLSFSAIYKNNQLQNLITRGDGKIGEDVSQNISIIENFPKFIKTDLSIFEIRGEIYMDKEDFFELNELTPFANPRNAAAGTLRNLEIESIKNRKLKYFAYSIANNIENFSNSQQESLQKGRNLDININQETIVTNSIQEIKEFYKKIENIRHSLPYDIDGIVVKVNSFELQKRLGSTNHSPRWAIAYKFNPKEAKTLVLDVAHQVGRTGIITPVAVLEPINIGGIVIRKATLHNYDEILKKDIKINDIVTIVRSGDVIPYIVKRQNRDRENSIYKDITFPEKCPSCEKELKEIKDKTVRIVKCINKEFCKEQIIQRIRHFTSRDALDIKGLGIKIISKLYEEGLLRQISDIWNLKNHQEKIRNMENFGEKSTNLLIESIESIKEIPLSKFLYSLGLENVGEVASIKLAEYFISIENIINNKNLENELLSIEGIGISTKNEILESISNSNILEEIAKISKNVKILEYKSIKKYNIKILFTGVFSKSRQEIKEFATQNKFTVVSSVSNNLDYLIYGDKPGSKLKKAQDLNIKTITEDEFFNLAKNLNFKEN